MALKVELLPISLPEHELEEIRVVDHKGESKRIGFCPTTDGAMVRFVRIPNTEAQANEVLAEVTRMRAERGLTTNTATTQPPDPAKLERLIKKGVAK